MGILLHILWQRCGFSPIWASRWCDNCSLVEISLCDLKIDELFFKSGRECPRERKWTFSPAPQAAGHSLPGTFSPALKKKLIDFQITKGNNAYFRRVIMSTGKKGKSSLPPHNGSEVKYVPKKKKINITSKYNAMQWNRRGAGGSWILDSLVQSFLI